MDSVDTSLVASRESIYSDLCRDLKHIRVLHIQPGLPTDPLRCHLQIISIGKDHVPFDALSYVWGKEYHPTTIQLCGEPHRVTVNLYSALKSLRKIDNAYIIWIDALCINQTDLDERSYQVGLMQEIYCNAESVVAWLGESDGPRDKIVLALRIFNEIWSLACTAGSPHWGKRISSFRSREPHVYTHLLGYCETFHDIGRNVPNGLHAKFGLTVPQCDPHKIWPVRNLYISTPLIPPLMPPSHQPTILAC
jgi:hypothetical protein